MLLQEYSRIIGTESAFCSRNVPPKSYPNEIRENVIARSPFLTRFLASRMAIRSRGKRVVGERRKRRLSLDRGTAVPE